MEDSASFPFLADASTPAGSLPFLTLTLRHETRSVEIQGLIDTGASVNVLPYDLGIRLGGSWNAEAPTIELTGNLARFKAQPLIVTVEVAHFGPIRMAFAWTKATDVPLILGQVNFFMEFDVCFFRSMNRFEVRPRSPA